MNYIIFGGTGFIGTHLANLIKEHDKNAQVWNLDIVDPSKLDKWNEERRVKTAKLMSLRTNEEFRINRKIEEYTTIKQWKSPVVDGEARYSKFVYCDVRKPIENLPFTPTSDDVIFNLAAVHRTPGHPDPAYFETNIRGAEQVCAFAEQWGIRNMVFTSSIAPYGAAEELKEEDTLPTPNTPYGISKLVAEKIHLAWQHGGADRKLTIVRPGVVFGKGENGNFSRLYRAIKGHKFAYPGRMDTIKACVYVKELVRFILWNVEERPSACETYNCTFEPAYTIEQIVETMKQVTGLRSYIPYIPNALIMPVAWMAQCLGSPMGICPARVKKLQISTNICGKKMAASGYRFKWTFEEALQDWYKDNGNQCLE